MPEWQRRRSPSTSAHSAVRMRMRRTGGRATTTAWSASRLAEQRERPLGTVLCVEREQQDALPLAEAEGAVGDRDLLRARAEEEREQLLPPRLARRDDPLEQRLEILEESRLPLLHPDDRVRA